MGKAFTWLATNGGAWSLAADWDDQTDGISPSLLVPGAQDSVTVNGPGGSTIETITGPGSALWAGFTGNTALAGTFSFATLSLGASGAGGLLDLGSGSLAAGTAAIASGSMIANGAGSALRVSGTLTLGAGQDGIGAASCNLDATAGGAIQAAALLMDASSAAIYVDPTSTLEVGTRGGAAPGTLTVDAGATLAGQGDANAYAAVANNGTIFATGGELMIGSLSGTGLLSIDAGAVLDLNGTTGVGQAVQFSGANGTLAISTEFDAPAGTISLLGAGDAIDMLGSPISAATYKSTGTNLGVLTLWYGGQIADVLTLAGNYSNDVFLTAGDGGFGTLITVAPETNGGGSPSPGTSGPDRYLWTAVGGGNWNQKTNWADLTTGKNPAGIAPGANNIVTIAAANTGSFAVIAGPANTASLTVTGDVALAGTYAIGGLTVGDGPDQVTATLDLVPKTVVTAGSAWVADGELSVSGSAVLNVTGALTLGGGASGVGMPITALSVTAGGTVTAASLTLGGGSGDTITTDPTGIVEVGGVGHGVVGAVTVDAGGTLTGNGSVNPFGAIVDNGMIDAAGGALTLGTVTGSGTLLIGDSAGLVFEAGNAMNIGFTDNNGLLAIADELISLSGTISGYSAGDIIDIENDPITGLNATASGNNTILSLYYGSTLVNTMILAGSFTGDHFVLVPDGGNGTEILLTGGGGGGGGGGQGNTDLLAWATPGNGSWSNASSWYDVTTGSAALAAPGAQNSVQIVGPTGAAIQAIGGPGLCASLGFWGNSLLIRNFTTGTLTIGGTISGSLASGLVEFSTSAGLTATVQGEIIDGTLAVGNAGALSVGGTLSIGDGLPGDSGAVSLLSVSSGAIAQVGGLVLGGGADCAVQTDATGSLEVGTLGGAIAGAITIDTGMQATGCGELNIAGEIVDNGLVAAMGGTLSVGAVSGLGTLAIGAEAVLALDGTETCPIVFSGGGATLLLEGTEETPAGVIYGFGPGDAIVTGSSQVSAVAWNPGAGTGTLVLYNGSQVAGTLLLSGNYAGDTFSVQPDGAGSEINVQSASGGPSPGTSTPDNYVWLGGHGTGWNTSQNWEDTTAGQDPAAIAPGAHDLVTVVGGTGNNYTAIVGPADAASLALGGNVSLSGSYTVGLLTIGHGSVLALGTGAAMASVNTALNGELVLQSGGLTVGNMLTLNGGVLVAGGGAILQTGTLAIGGTGAVITVDAASTLEVGDAGGAAVGALTVDPNAILSGAGIVDPLGMIIDAGTITASAGTLSLGNVSGTGTLLVGVGATLALDGTVASSLLVDFAGPGTFAAMSVAPAADIANFGDGDQIFVPVQGVIDTEYTPTAPNLGVLSLLANGSVVATLTLVGVGIGQSFATTATGGGTIITTETTDWGGGGGTMGNGQDTTSSGTFGVVQDFGFWAGLPAEAQTVLAQMQASHGNEAWVDFSVDGTSWDNPAPAVANFAVITDPVPHTLEVLPAGYNALLAQGTNPVWLADGGLGTADSLIVGNDGNDTISGLGIGDTMVASGGNTLFFAEYEADIFGAGNDTIITGQGNVNVTTSAIGRSVLFLGAASNNVVSQGNDLVIAAPGPGANDTIWAMQSDTVFTASEGRTTIITGNGPSAIIANPGELAVDGGNGNGSVVFCGAASFTDFNGGGGSAAIIGGSGELSVHGGAGALTVFGGTGAALITGAPGPSFYLMGEGPSTVTAATGNHVWLVGAANESLVASGGDVILWGAGSAGNDVLQAGNGPCTMSGGYGRDTMIGGGGAATMIAGSGLDIFSFTNGLSGGSDTISGFNTANDDINLYGYGGYNSSMQSGSEVITLSDGTRIQLSGVTSLTGVHINLN